MDIESVSDKVRKAYQQGPEVLIGLVIALVGPLETLTERITALEAADAARGQGLCALAEERKRAFASRYDVLLAAGLKMNPPPEPTGQRGRPKRGKAGNLLERLQERKGATLAFMEDLTLNHYTTTKPKETSAW